MKWTSTIRKGFDQGGNVKKAGDEKQNRSSRGEIVVYQSDDGRIKLDVRLQDETVWLTQQLIAELFQTTVPNISMHIRNIFEEGELTPAATVKKFLTVRREGSRMGNFRHSGGLRTDLERVHQIFQRHPKQTAFCRYRHDRRRTHSFPSRSPAAQHGSNDMESWRGTEG
jgi:hypothetical protein